VTVARVLYGVHGTGKGHAIRALTVGRRFRQHEFLFVAHGDALRLLAPEFHTFECPNPETVVHAHRVAVWPTLRSLVATLHASREWMARLRAAARDFRPDVAVTDYEFFVPRVAGSLGIPCLSLDNLHVIPFCRLSVPAHQLPSYLVTMLAVRLLFSRADAYVVTSFFRPPLRRTRAPVRLMPPLLREEVAAGSGSPGDHVLAYQGHETFRAFLPLLAETSRPVAVYGVAPAADAGGRLRFMPWDETRFLEDLASCAYVVCGGGHTLISEALHLGKPVLVFPVRNFFEQYLNGLWLARLGYGDLNESLSPHPALLRRFEERLPLFSRAAARGEFCGNREIFAQLQSFFTGGALPARGPDSSSR
jgi:uncharacterized protein (TIGR00661 family)